MNRNNQQPKKIAAMAPYERGWSNVELVKDCGLIPYLLHKNHGCEVTMVGARTDTYSYLELVKGLKMEFLPDGSEGSKLLYLKEHASEIDALIIRSCYPTNFNVAKLYRELNPTGKIYVGLDANSPWMDRIPWEQKRFHEFMDTIDVIAASCITMQKHLNRKWPWKIEYIPNGYYDFKQEYKPPVFSEKDNTILTVGRLGTSQKATPVLTEAFAAIAKYIPDWNLRLVGTIDAAFHDYIAEYFHTFPELKERVTFAGPIYDRDALAKEYQRAKIFALPSAFEGGTPNVIAEALNAGCVTAVTAIDGWKEAVGEGTCGLTAKIGDVCGFAEILLTLCRSQNLEILSANAYQYCRTHLNMEQIVAKLNELLLEELQMNTIKLSAEALIYENDGQQQLLIDCLDYLSNDSRIPLSALYPFLNGLKDVCPPAAQSFADEPYRTACLLLDILLIRRLLQSPHPVRVLEMGCDNGYLSFHLASVLGKFHSGSSLCCLSDVMGNESGSTWLEHMVLVSEPPKFSWTASDYDDTLLAPDSFDVVVVNGSAAFADPAAVLREALRLCKSSGRLLCFSPDQPPLTDAFRSLCPSCEEYPLSPQLNVLCALCTKESSSGANWREKLADFYQGLQNTLQTDSSIGELRALLQEADALASLAMQEREIGQKAELMQIKNVLLDRMYPAVRRME